MRSQGGHIGQTDTKNGDGRSDGVVGSDVPFRDIRYVVTFCGETTYSGNKKILNQEVKQ